VDRMRRDVQAFKAAHRGFDPLDSEAGTYQLTNLRSDLADLQRRHRELQVRLDGRLSVLNASPTPQQPVVVANLPQPEFRSPRSMALATEMRRFERHIEELKATRGMTDRHPDIQRLRNQWDLVALEAEEQRAIDALGVSTGVADAGGSSDVASLWASARSEAEAETAVLRQLLADTQGEIDMHEQSIADMEDAQAQVLDRREEFTKRASEMERLGSDLTLYRRYADQVGRLLEAENSQRGILFEKIRPATGSRIPVSPRMPTILVLTVSAGVAVGVIFVLLAELLDRTIRTRRQIARELGLNILETIDVIMTSAVRRRRLARTILAPAVTAVLAVAVVLSGSLAFLSLEHRAAYDRVLTWPGSVARQVLDRWGVEQKLASNEPSNTEHSG